MIHMKLSVPKFRLVWWHCLIFFYLDLKFFQCSSENLQKFIYAECLNFFINHLTLHISEAYENFIQFH